MTDTFADTFETPGPGRNVAVLRKQRGISQLKLANKAGVSVSLLSKIEIGDRTLSPAVAAALATAMGITLDEVLGKASVKQIDEASLQELRATIRRFDLPGEPPSNPKTLHEQLVQIVKFRDDANLSGLLHKLPGALSKATNQAYSDGLPESWSVVADMYSAVYYLAARHRWMDLAELAVMKQRLAAERAGPLVAAIAVRDNAGTFLNSGDFEGGLVVVDQGIIQVESSMNGREKALALGTLHLRGMTLAGRLRDRSEAERHIAAAWCAAENFPEDISPHGMHFGPENTANHLVSTSTDLENYRQALEIWDNMRRQPLKLPPTRQVDLHLNVARAQLGLRDRDAALDSLVEAWNVAPQKAKVHPTSLELMRVLISLHKRSNPTLTRLAKKAGLSI